jgi:hypothetical protein
MEKHDGASKGDRGNAESHGGEVFIDWRLRIASRSSDSIASGRSKPTDFA